MKKNADLLSIISKERISDELNKMLITNKPDIAVRLLKITGLYKHIFPELEDIFDLEQNQFHKDKAFEHTIEVLKNVPPILKTRLAALFHDIGKGQTKSTVHFIECENCHKKIGVEPNEI